MTPALEALDGPDGVQGARSIDASMNQGREGLADYNIWLEDFDARVSADRDLDDVRRDLWEAFQL